MEAQRICKACRQPLPENAPEGLCPACLAKVALGTEPAAPGATLNINPLAAGAAPASAPVTPGPRIAPDVSQLAAQFPQLEIIELLGMGGMGMVYKARQPNLDRLVALKILPKESAPHPSFAERFSREAKALAKLNHPGIVNVYDFGQTSEYYYFVMEYVDGMNLRALLNHQPITPHQALELVVQICTALQFAHDEGVVHRDIKPENILITKKGQVKIADFGLAKLLGNAPDTALTMSQAAMGTMNYMAPEQRQNAQTVDHRADIYSLGVVFYEMLTGEVPMGRFEVPSKRVQIDVRLDEVVLRALEREPARRYQQASEVKTSVETITSTPLTPPVAPPAAPAQASVVPARFPFSDFFALAGFLLALWIASVTAQAVPVVGILLYSGILLAATFELALRLRIQKSRESGLWPQVGVLPTLEHVQRLAQAGEKKLAFKLYRQIHGGSAAKARAALETLTQSPAPAAPAQVARTRFLYSDIYSLALFLVALYTIQLAGQFAFLPGMAGVGASNLWMVVGLLYLGVFLIGIRQIRSRLKIQKSRERGLWPQLGELPTLEHVQRLARAGERELAIKLHRQIYAVSRPDAKAAVKKLTGDPIPLRHAEDPPAATSPPTPMAMPGSPPQTSQQTEPSKLDPNTTRRLEQTAARKRIRRVAWFAAWTVGIALLTVGCAWLVSEYGPADYSIEAGYATPIDDASSLWITASASGSGWVWFQRRTPAQPEAIRPYLAGFARQELIYSLSHGKPDRPPTFVDGMLHINLPGLRYWYRSVDGREIHKEALNLEGILVWLKDSGVDVKQTQLIRRAGGLMEVANNTHHQELGDVMASSGFAYLYGSSPPPTFVPLAWLQPSLYGAFELLWLAGGLFLIRRR